MQFPENHHFFISQHFLVFDDKKKEIFVCTIAMFISMEETSLKQINYFLTVPLDVFYLFKHCREDLSWKLQREYFYDTEILIRGKFSSAPDFPSAVPTPKWPRLWSLFYEKPAHRSSQMIIQRFMHETKRSSTRHTQEIYHSAQITKTQPGNYNSLNYGGWNVSRSNELVTHSLFFVKNSIKTSLSTANKIWPGLEW